MNQIIGTAAYTIAEMLEKILLLKCILLQQNN